jgi:hypothetical protein
LNPAALRTGRRGAGSTTGWGAGSRAAEGAATGATGTGTGSSAKAATSTGGVPGSGDFIAAMASTTDLSASQRVRASDEPASSAARMVS